MEKKDDPLIAEIERMKAELFDERVIKYSFTDPNTINVIQGKIELLERVEKLIMRNEVR